MTSDFDADTSTADLSSVLAIEDELGGDLDLDPDDLNRVVLVEEWGEQSGHWLAEQHACDTTSPSERELRLCLAAPAGLAPVLSLPWRRSLLRSAA